MKSTTTAPAVEEAVSEIMALQRSLPPRPLIEDLEAARTVIRNADAEQRLKLDAIGKQIKPNGVPEELWAVLQEMRRKAVEFLGEEERREAARVLEVEQVHQVFDELILRASRCVGVGGADEKVTTPVAMVPESVVVVESEKNERRTASDDSFVKKPKSDFEVDGSRNAVSVIAEAPQIVDITLKLAIDKGEGGEKLSLIKLASLIEVSSKKGVRELDLRARLLDQVEWLPDSIGKLSGLVTLDLSENRIVTLPTTIGGLASLTKLDLHSNRLYDVPESIGDLLSLVYLDLSVNQLSSLPSSVGRLVNLEELKLGSNQLGLLPDAIGSLASLEKLDVEANNLEELPYTIGQCTELKELYADYNRLKALPEAVGRIESLEVLSLRYNNIKQLPTTMGSLVKLRELNVSFNEVEVVPESLCFATSLVKLNIGNNFADLRYLPRSIGNLENLEELDISNNQIRILPESFRLLTKLRVLRADQNPLEVPPRQIAAKGAEAVVQYMADLTANRDVKVQPVKQKKIWSLIYRFFSKSSERKHNVATI
ncbi:hypothetical protein Droror1_Dr00010979 [Drosera rotundifolia]